MNNITLLKFLLRLEVDVFRFFTSYLYLKNVKTESYQKYKINAHICILVQSPVFSFKLCHFSEMY